METFWLVGRKDMSEENESMVCMLKPKRKRNNKKKQNDDISNDSISMDVSNLSNGDILSVIDEGEKKPLPRENTTVIPSIIEEGDGGESGGKKDGNTTNDNTTANEKEDCVSNSTNNDGEVKNEKEETDDVNNTNDNENDMQEEKLLIDLGTDLNTTQNNDNGDTKEDDKNQTINNMDAETQTNDKEIQVDMPIINQTDTTSLKGDNTSVKGDNTSLKGDNTSLKGENISVKGDTTSVKGENEIKNNGSNPEIKIIYVDSVNKKGGNYINTTRNDSIEKREGK